MHGELSSKPTADNDEESNGGVQEVPKSTALSLRWKVALGPLVVGALGITIYLISVAKSTEGMRPLTPGQVMCSLGFGFGFLTWGLVHGTTAISVLREWSSEGSVAGCKTVWRLHAKRWLNEENLGYLNSFVEFGGIMLVYYLVDRTPLFPRATKHYDRDQYWFIWVCIVAAGLFTLRRTKADDNHEKPLVREQTEEWKGWMQIQFLLYHYFAAVEMYNAIRMYIAAYVWMTGFGNFSYYYIKEDFSLYRFFSMMWRLNFFVAFCCVVLENQYMLYYICMLHTTFTVVIWASLGTYSHLNKRHWWMKGKFVLLFIVTLALWNIPGLFTPLWTPLRWLVRYDGGINEKIPETVLKNPLHEWQFRSTLDHLVWIFGMLTAYNHPHADAYLEKMDRLPPKLQYSIKAAIAAVVLFLFRAWWQAVFTRDKFSYNAYHPFTSWIPITLYIVLRNLVTRARLWYMHLFAWMGKITLETYIGQFHIWMATTGVNGSPKLLVRVLPEGYPLLNFTIVSAAYVYISYRVFQITLALKPFAIPSDKTKFQRNMYALPLGVIAMYGAGWIIRAAF